MNEPTRPTKEDLGEARASREERIALDVRGTLAGPYARQLRQAVRAAFGEPGAVLDG